jgi:hypothetical protein
MKIQEVITKQQVQEFLKLPVKLYKNEPQWIQPLDKDIESVFDPQKNKTFRHGKCIRWILLDDNQQVIGRVAAFVNDKTTKKGNDQPTGGLGFFECINDQQAAFMLFDQCKQWLQSQGMEAMDGPINFGNRDKWWGLLVWGFEKEPNYQCNYNFPYYVNLFEAYGFQVYFYQLTYGRTVMGMPSHKIITRAQIVANDPDYEFRHIRKDEVSKLAEYIHDVYNKAWGNRFENPELSMGQAKLIVKQMKPIMDLKLLYFGFYKGKPVSFFLSIPEVNQIFKHVNGKLNLIGYIKVLWHTIRKTNRKAFGVLFGVVPEHQAKGLDAGMIMASRQVLQDEYKRYDEYEINWIGDFNPKMINVVEQIDALLRKKHATYRKLFDESKPFKRATILK